jgi:putative phage-type endonuclease
MSELVTHFTEHAEYTGVAANDREAWLAMRHVMITASDVAALLGEDPHRAALDVYVDKITERGAQEQIGLDDPRFWGSALEQPILRAVAGFYRWDYHEGGKLLRSRAHPWIGATLDAEIDRHDGRGWIDLEGKTTRIPRGWDEDSGDLPTRVLVQAQSQLLVTGAPVALVFALLQGSRPVQIEVEPSADFHAVIVEETERFMDRVRRLDPPAPDGSRSSERALRRLYPTDDGGSVMLPDSAVDWTREIQELAAQQKALKAREDELRNLLRASIGERKYGLLPEKVGKKRCWRWQVQQRAAYTVEASESRVLLALNEPPVGVVEPVPTVPIAELLARSSLGARR